MEETRGKEVKMEAPNEEPLSYEKLKEIANKLYEDNRYLRTRLNQAFENLNMFNRLDYLFRVIEVSQKENRFSEEFITMCYSEVEKGMTPPEPEEESKTEEN